MPIAREEIFGPVLVVLTYATLDEAIAIANDSQYGLSAGIWPATTNGRSRWPDVCARARCGSTTGT